jgi:predicted O-linked N-acetylglucosamine transferase (SPINDLY family)
MQSDELLQRAVRHHQAGLLAEAETLYLDVLKLRPAHADALNLLGTIARQRGRPADAIPLIERAVARDRDNADFQFNLAEAQRAAGRLDDAVAGYRRAVALRPADPEVRHALGLALSRLGRHADAAAELEAAVRAAPRFLPAYDALAEALRRQRRLDDADAVCRRALSVAPDRAESHYGLALVAAQRGQVEAAVAGFGRAVALKPDWPEARMNLAVTLDRAGRRADATAECEAALRLRPGWADAWNLLGTLLDKQARLTHAVDAYRRALAAEPNHAQAQSHLGNVLKDLGLPDEAVAHHREAVRLDPRSAVSQDNLLVALNYLPSIDAAHLFDEHRQWGRRVAAAVAPLLPAPASAGPVGRRIRVGYISPDFRDHPVAAFVEPLLRHHDAAAFEVTCYSDVPRPDATTARLEPLPARWRPVAHLAHDALADLVRADGIDVLVDLAGHTAGNRLPAFARRPAPVQVTYLGYPNTTGLPPDVMRYRLSDAHADPPGETDPLHTEEVVRLPETFLCYAPPADAPDPAAAPPCAATGRVTFGSFNQFAKINPAVIELWSRVLAAVPGARLLLKTKSLADPRVRQTVAERFAVHGVGPDRLVLAPPDPSTPAHLARYADVDIALDPFPYHGTTTTCEALWMGVPVVTLAGRTHHARVGVSLLRNAGLGALVAADGDEYVRLAAALAADPPRLAHLRATLRESLRRSPLLDAVGFTRGLDAAYRTMLQRATNPAACA